MKSLSITFKNIQQTAFVWWLLSVLVVLSSAYLYYVNDAVRNVVLRERAEREVAEIASRLGELELAYRKAESTITIEHARSIGFVEVEKPLFVSRKAPTTALSLNGEI